MKGFKDKVLKELSQNKSLLGIIPKGITKTTTKDDSLSRELESISNKQKIP